MGFGGVTGLPMATRSGDVAEDALFYLPRQKCYDDVSLEHMLYHKSGLLGLSETSGDMRELQNSNDPRARQAFDYFVYAIRRLCTCLGRIGRARLYGRDRGELCAGSRRRLRETQVAWRFTRRGAE